MAGEFEKSFVAEAVRPRCVECGAWLKADGDKCDLCANLTNFETLLLRQLREINSSLIVLNDFLSENLAMAGRGF